MTRLRDRMVVGYAPSEAQLRLAAYFASLRKADGVARIRLRVPMTDTSGSLALVLSREVRIEAQPAPGGRNCHEIWISWEPEGRTVLPKFQGRLCVRSAIRNDRCSIELDGGYQPRNHKKIEMITLGG